MSLCMRDNATVFMRDNATVFPCPRVWETTLPCFRAPVYGRQRYRVPVSPCMRDIVTATSAKPAAESTTLPYAATASLPELAWCLCHGPSPTVTIWGTGDPHSQTRHRHVCVCVCVCVCVISHLHQI